MHRAGSGVSLQIDKFGGMTYSAQVTLGHADVVGGELKGTREAGRASCWSSSGWCESSLRSSVDRGGQAKKSDCGLHV